MTHDSDYYTPPKGGRKRRKRKGKGFLIFFTILLFLISIPLVGGTGLFLYYIKDTPELDFSKLEDTAGSKLRDKDGTPFLEIGKKRETIEPNEIPDTLKDAIISIEDKRFEKHLGVDPIRIAGAAVSNLQGDRGKQGGSTLTQQLIKLSFFSTDSADQNIKRKAQEAYLAVELEKQKSKDEILTYYINKVYMANGIYGMQTAAEVYFNKNLDDLTLAEYALLAGMPQAPNDYDPYINADLAGQRRNLVLSEMYKDGYINQEDYKEASESSVTEGLIPLKEDSTMDKVTDNYVTEVIKEVKEKTGKDVYSDGLDIYTNLDLSAQTYMYNLVNGENSTIVYPDDEFQTTATLVDVKTGFVRAQIGGRNQEGLRSDNLAVSSKRNIGSTAKPLIAYAPIIETLNYGSGQIFSDSPYTYSDGVSVYNYDKLYQGNITMRQALMDSRNIPALKAQKEVGDDVVSEIATRLGIDSEIYESSALGIDTSTEKLAASYSAFANGGIYYTPSYINKIVFNDETEQTFAPDGSRAIKESTAYIITDMLKDVISQGTGYRAQIDGLIQAGKTGTSNYTDDAIDKIKGDGEGVPDITFVGYTPKYSLAIWTGYSDYFQPITLDDQKLAQEIYRATMTYLYRDLAVTDWKQPSDVVRFGNEVSLKGYNNQSNTQGYGYESNTTFYNQNNYNTAPGAGFGTQNDGTTGNQTFYQNGQGNQ